MESRWGLQASFEALVPALHRPPLLRVHVDEGGDEVVHLVALYFDRDNAVVQADEMGTCTPVIVICQLFQF